MAEINRSELRKIIMTALYQMSVYDANKIEYEPKAVIKELLEVENEFVKQVVYGCVTYKDKIDKVYTLVFEKEDDHYIFKEAK